MASPGNRRDSPPTAEVDFDTLPLVEEGDSKIVRYLGRGWVAIRLKPNVYSFTANRAGVVPGSDRLRFEASHVLTRVLSRRRIAHAFESHDRERSLIVSRLAIRPTPQGVLFSPRDIDPATLPVFAPLEVVVKASHVGTPRHRYAGTDQHPTRSGLIVEPGTPYPIPQVRFDWRNPHEFQGRRLGDEPMPEDLAALWIDVRRARRTALRAFHALAEFLAGRGLRLIDICFFMDAEGRMILSEISPDCLRVTAGGESLDKDVWRSGGDSGELLSCWARFVERIARSPEDPS